MVSLVVLAVSYNGCILYEWICLFSLQNLSRSEPITSGGAAARAAQAKKEKKKRMPKLEEFLQSRDYVGAMTLLDVSCCLFHCYGNQLRMRTPYLYSLSAALVKAHKTQIYGWHTVHSTLETMSKQEQ